ncbi:MAG TPA: aminoacyl-tRNA hydrolase [Candidatus Saccharimonadia bacterium]|nr:aminoacyl-tRNA hydrolase [Candidatus Saccharimonadia bacterium]
MALFVNKPTPSDSKYFYTLGLNKTVLIVGLGNNGKEFDKTRHNIGFECADKFVDTYSEMSDWINKKDLMSLQSSGQMGETRVIVIKPTTMMNLSGEAVELTSNFYKIKADQILVLHDELDISFGKINFKLDGSSAGHNGIQSIIDKIDENFPRIRIGIGPKLPTRIDSADFVLQKFSKDQLLEIEILKKEVASLVTEFIYTPDLQNETRSFLT